VRLTLRYHDVRALDFGPPRLENGRLSVDAEALRAELLTDPRIANVEVQRVDAQENCRIMSIYDVVQPRCKVEPVGSDYPGALSGVGPSGSGVTRVLRGVALTVVAPVGGRRFLNLRPPRPGEPFDRYAGLHHVVVLPTAAEGVAGDEWRNASA